MGLIRFLFLLLIVGVLWFMAKNFVRKQEIRRRKEQESLPRERIVRCRQCDVHLPEAAALREGDEWFCSQAHRQAWLTRNDKP